MFLRNALILAASVSLVALPALAQDSGSGSAPPPPPAGVPSDYTPGSTVSTGANGQPLLPEGNPLQNLFTPQPQYPTPQSVTNPQPSFAQGDDRPVTRIFSVNNNNPDKPPEGTNNMLQGVFTAQPQYVTPQTQLNQYGQALNALPGYGQAKLDDLKNAKMNYQLVGEDKPHINDGSDKPADAKAAEKAPEDKDKTAKADKDKDGKGKDDKSKDDKSKDGKTASKDDKDGKDKAADGKGDDKKTADAKDDKDAKDEKTADAKDADKKDEKDEKDEKPVASGPYNPLKEAVFLLNAGQPAQAVGLLANILKKNPANAEAHYLAAISFVTLRDYKLAADEYSVVLRLVPATPLAQLAVDGLKKIGMQPNMPLSVPNKLPPLVRKSAKPSSSPARR